MVTEHLRRPASPSSMRSWNEYVVLSALTAIPQRISELAQSTGLTVPALGDVLRGLQEKGWVRSSEPSTNSRGRPAQLYSLSQPPGCVIGVDIGAHAIRISALDLWGNLLGNIEDRLGPAADTGQLIRAVEDLSSELLDAVGNPKIWLSAIAIPGHVAEDGQVIDSVVVPDWHNAYPAHIFRDVFPSPIIAINDVRAATWAEKCIGAAQPYSDVLFVKLGRRPALGLLNGGEPQIGSHGIAGDLSRSKLLPSEERIDWLSALPQEDPLRETILAGLNGDQTAINRVKDYVESISDALILAISVIDPAVFVLAGPLSPLAPHFLPRLQAKISEAVAIPPVTIASTLDQFASAQGGALIGIHRIKTMLTSPETGVKPLTRSELKRQLGQPDANPVANQ